MNLQVLINFCLINIVGLISPGPDFFIVLRNTLNFNKLSGVFTALGIATGVFVLFAISFLGVAVIIVGNKMLFLLLRVFGFMYLTFLGMKSLVFFKSVNDKELLNSNKNINSALYLNSYFLGLCCNLSNPKALLFIISLATYVISNKNTILNNFIYAIIAGVSAFLWFSFVATIFDSKVIRNSFLKYQKQINIVLGLLLLYIAIKIILL